MNQSVIWWRYILLYKYQYNRYLAYSQFCSSSFLCICRIITLKTSLITVLFIIMWLSVVQISFVFIYICWYAFTFTLVHHKKPRRPVYMLQLCNLALNSKQCYAYVYYKGNKNKRNISNIL